MVNEISHMLPVNHLFIVEYFQILPHNEDAMNSINSQCPQLKLYLLLSGGTDLYTVAVHEFGHSLGLSHSYSPDSIMRPFYVYAKNLDRVLTSDDIAGVQYLYGEQSSKTFLIIIHYIYTFLCSYITINIDNYIWIYEYIVTKYIDTFMYSMINA